MNSFQDLPKDLPVPEDDGACDHLTGAKLPDITLPTTNDDWVNLSNHIGILVVYFYPMTGRPNVPPPDGWDEIPGARGCTPQSCSFRDHFSELSALGASIFGMSTQDTSYQKEMVERLQLPFPVISDSNLEYSDALKIPTFYVDKKRLMKRVTLIVIDGVISTFHYPIFPSYSDPEWVISYLSSHDIS
ncbi:MAG: peroxiredoxin [Pseudomonadota bacterium]|nr:peroxiredoxin [Pseudomonadota bacterium]